MRLALRKTVLETRAIAASGEDGRTQLDVDAHGAALYVRDSRVFHPARRAFCIRLLEAAVEQPNVRRARVDLAANTCRFDYGPKSRSTSQWAETFAAAVRQAVGTRADQGATAWLGSATGESVLTAYPADGGASLWQSTAKGPARFRLRHRALAGNYIDRARLSAEVQKLPGVLRCNAGLWAPVFTVDLEPNRDFSDGLSDQIECLRASLGTAAAGGTGPLAARRVSISPARLSRGWRVLNALLAGGCLTLTGAALLVPGMPTLPFLLAASYYLARSSPRFDGFLHRTPIIGRVLNEWETRRGLSGRSKRNLIGLTTIILLATLVLFSVSAVSLALMLPIFALSVRSIARMPGLPPMNSDDTPLRSPVRAAIVGPAA